ncbi:hypothetical protein JCM19236_2150 [Vibrio sp. JCM 19236]|nr:hypothetical protein JCM19236_2150 [Vibrio sp. JCM 19236]
MSLKNKTALTFIVAAVMSTSTFARDTSQTANEQTALPEAGIGLTAGADSLPNFTFKKHKKVERVDNTAQIIDPNHDDLPGAIGWSVPVDSLPDFHLKHKDHATH